MSKNKLFVGAVLASITGVAAAVGSITDSGNQSSGTVVDAMEGYILQPLSVELVDSLVFPDLVVPSVLGEESHVTVSETTGDVSYSTNGNPSGPSALAKTDYTNLGGVASRLGKIEIKGHENKAISVQIALAGTVAVLDSDGYAMVPALALGSNTANTVLADGSSTTSSTEQSTLEVFFGGTLTAKSISSGANIGRVTQDLLVTVSYY